MKQFRILLAVALMLSPLVGCTISRGGAPDPELQDDRPTKSAEGVVHLPEASMQFLTVEAVGTGDRSVELRVPARVAFRDGAVSRVGAPLPGRVTRVLVKTGDRVRAGDPLVVLASPEAAAARTALASARASLREAEANLARETRMLDEGVGIERDRLAAEARLAEVRAEVDRAEATSVLLGEGAGTELAVRAPITGTVLEVKTSAGAAVEQGGDALVEVGDPAALCVVADVNDHEVSLIREGASAQIELSSEVLPATVVSVGAVVSSGLRTAPVRLALAGPLPFLRPGMFGVARITVAPAGSSLPTEAVLVKDGRDSIVYVAKDDRSFERRRVVVGRPIEGRIQVLSGITAGERVVVKGALLLDGAAEQLL